MKDAQDTIVAPATPPGRGAVQIIRLSGPQAFSLATALLARDKLPPPGRNGLRQLVDPRNGQMLDDALILVAAAPASLTGEDVVELQLHGSPLLRQEILEILTGLGARPAEAGEFTLRAFLNGKQDLTQAEAVHDLIEARSPQALRLAALQLQGGLTKTIEALGHTVLQLATRLEAELDFPDDVETLPQLELQAALDSAIGGLARQSNTLTQGQLWREGFRVVLMGPPNAGKSSLFNALLGQDRAIVTQEAGTTRDYLEGWLPDATHPICLVDTAGLRRADSLAEEAGIQRSRQQLESAALVLSLVDLTAPEVHPLPDFSGPVWTLGTKADLVPHGPAWPEWQLSSQRSTDVSSLRQRLAGAAAEAFQEAPPLGALTNLRQQDAVRRAHDILVHVRDHSTTLPRDIIASQVRLALANLSEITGHRGLSEEILNGIFNQFCIGK